jgi:hypothetical protein
MHFVSTLVSTAWKVGLRLRVEGWWPPWDSVLKTESHGELWGQAGKQTQMPPLQGGGSLMARDVWQNQTLGAVKGDYLNATVGPHEVRLFRVWRAGGAGVKDGPP